ncbi:hypothetical protein CLF_100315 [Clonorchis sinensis]|uniref:Uncharacterized protein n=1 Tax=Clonorchis sinensis TaxID=79923 RepID=G7Y366_CLOSI|nr:hypothetical protein CLF_100315 [Clonorchis sinensis]
MPQSYRFKLIFSIEIGPHLIAFRILLGCGVMISEFSAAMELEELKARIQASYAKRRERIEEEIAVTETAIEDLEVLMIRNRRSYDEQTKRTNSMRKKPVTRLRKIIAGVRCNKRRTNRLETWNVCSSWFVGLSSNKGKQKPRKIETELQMLRRAFGDFRTVEVENSAREIQRRIKLREQWLKANQCWIMIYQDVLQKKHERWRKEVNAMRLRLQAIEASEGFVYAVFGGGPSGLLRNQIKLEKAGPKASMLVQPLTKEDKIWLGQRRKDIESIITQPSCDRIKQIELQLRTSGLTTAETSSRCSSPVQPPGTHPLLKHHVQLKEAIQGDRDELRKVSRQLQQRLEEEKTLKEEWEKVFEKLRQNYSKSEQEYRNQMDEHNTRLKEIPQTNAPAITSNEPGNLLIFFLSDKASQLPNTYVLVTHQTFRPAIPQKEYLFLSVPSNVKTDAYLKHQLMFQRRVPLTMGIPSTMVYPGSGQTGSTDIVIRVDGISAQTTEGGPVAVSGPKAFQHKRLHREIWRPLSANQLCTQLDHVAINRQLDNSNRDSYASSPVG